MPWQFDIRHRPPTQPWRYPSPHIPNPPQRLDRHGRTRKGGEFSCLPLSQQGLCLNTIPPWFLPFLFEGHARPYGNSVVGGCTHASGPPWAASIPSVRSILPRDQFRMKSVGNIQTFDILRTEIHERNTSREHDPSGGGRRGGGGQLPPEGGAVGPDGHWNGGSP